MSTSLPLPQPVEDPVIPAMETWGEEVVFWARGKERFRSAIRSMAPRFKAEFATLESMVSRAKEIQLFIARGILTEAEFEEWDRPAASKSATVEQKKAAAKIKTAHQKRVYKGYSDLCQDVFGKTPSKSAKPNPGSAKEEKSTPVPDPMPELTTSVPVPESALPGIMEALRREGGAGIVHGSLVYNWTTHTYEARNEKMELVDFFVLTEGMSDPFAEEHGDTIAEEIPAGNSPATPTRTGTPILDPDEELLSVSLSALTHEEQKLDACVLCNETCPLAEQLVAECCVGKFHKQCLLEGFSLKYSDPSTTEVECLYCSTPHPMEWANKLVFG